MKYINSINIIMSNKLCSILINEVSKHYNDNKEEINNCIIKPLIDNIYKNIYHYLYFIFIILLLIILLIIINFITLLYYIKKIIKNLD